MLMIGQAVERMDTGRRGHVIRSTRVTTSPWSNGRTAPSRPSPVSSSARSMV